jgi:hypothetical protein
METVMPYLPKTIMKIKGYNLGLDVSPAQLRKKKSYKVLNMVVGT